MQTKIILCGFDFAGKSVYNELTNVLIYSIEKYMPDAEWILNWLEEPELNGKIKGIVTNTVKLDKWVEELNKCKFGDRVIFLDCDMLLLGSLDGAFDDTFDVGYTERDESIYPINGGAIYVNVNEKSIKFFNKFKKVNDKMYHDVEFHQVWRKKYAGMNQAAFGYMLENKSNIAKLKSLPCSKWNVCQNDWCKISDDARLLHIKGRLRSVLFKSDPIPEDLKKSSDLWLKHKNELNLSEKKYI